MYYLTSLWSTLHRRGIQAILLAGCLLGFGLGQTLGASYRPFADNAHRTPPGQVGAAAATNRAGSDLGNNVAGQQATGVTHVPVQQTMAQTSPGKSHQASTDGNSGKGDGKGKGNGGKKPPKAKGHRTGNDGGPHGKDSSNARHDMGGATGGGSHGHGHNGKHGGGN